MFRHVVVFRWSAESTESQRGAALAALREWAVVAAEFGHVTVGADAGVSEGNFDAVVIGEFADQDAWAAYAADERHRQMIATHLTPNLGTRVAVQFRS